MKPHENNQCYSQYTQRSVTPPIDVMHGKCSKTLTESSMSGSVSGGSYRLEQLLSREEFVFNLNNLLSDTG